MTQIAVPPAPQTSNKAGTEDFLVMKDITKKYHTVAAIKNVNFKLRRGEVHALLGENGAGKSTLSKILSGVVSPTSGTIIVDGRQLVASTPGQAREYGIVMVHQETSLVPSMTVAQNLFLGEEKAFNALRPLYIEAQVLLHSMNFDVDPRALVATLGAAKKQMVEIARAVRQKSQIIIFDEPTATLTPVEKENFFALVKRLKQDSVSVIFISHALEEALSIADRITILRDGEVVISDDARRFDRQRIVSAMVGRELTDEVYGERSREGGRKRGPVMLNVESVSMGKMVRNNSFSIYGGQITGMFGLIGSGRSETAQIICGMLRRNTFHGGTIRLNGQSVRYKTPRAAVRDGIAYVTEDRKVEGFFDSMSIGENTQLGKLAAQKALVPAFRKSDAKTLYKVWKERLSIRALGSSARVLELSGGNQQKVVIAKSLVQTPRLIIFDEPTRGVDVGSIVEIHRIIQGLADQGLAVVVISSYLPEIQNLSDRILVTRGGRVVAEFDRGSTAEEIMFAAAH
jgi:simple sugar transport system ATP-binding protein